MFKVFMLLFGIASGAAGATAWLLSEPGAASARLASAPNPIADRFGEVQVRFREALAEGKVAGAETETRLRAQLNTYRRPSAAS